MRKSWPWPILFILLYVYGSWLIDNRHGGYYISSDAEGYFMYLPAVFIHHRFENIPVKTVAQFPDYPGTHKPWNRYTYGVALMEAPFFLAAYASRWIQKLDLSDPFAADYSVALLLAGSFYLTFGLFFLYKTLIRIFDPPPGTAREWATGLNGKRIVWITLVVLVLGTNLLHYAIREPGMSHIYSFALICILQYYLPAFYRTPSVRNTLRVGLPFCLTTLIRPTNILLFIFIFLFDVYTRPQFRERIRWYVQNFRYWALVPVIGFLLAIPQMCYWYYLTGQPIFYSYSGGNGAFIYWAQPKLYNIFFHLCNGFLVYSPLMIFALIGTVLLAVKNKENGRPVGALFMIVAYVCASWQFWWFGGAYGYRAFIDFYPLPAVGLAYYFSRLFQSGRAWLIALHIIILIFFIGLNLRMDSIRYYYQIEPDAHNAEVFWTALRKSLWLEP